MAATVRDVALKAGVSVGTVSRFLNGYNLKNDNYSKVKQAIKELNFKENMIAKGLKKNRTMTVGVVIGSLTDIFATSIVLSIEKELDKYGYSIIVCDYEGDAGKQENKLRFLKNRSIDGVIVYSSGHYTQIFYEYMEAGIPLVLINDDIPELRTDKVLVDNANASFRAVEHLIHNNHKEIAVINGPLVQYSSNERYKGYVSAHEVYNLPVCEKLIKNNNYNSAAGYKAVQELMKDDNPPTAIFTTNFYLTLGAIMALNHMNIIIPDDLSVVGFDYFEQYDVIRPHLTMIEQPTDKIGVAAAQCLLRRIKGDYSDYPRHEYINTRMLLRDSVSNVNSNIEIQ